MIVMAVDEKGLGTPPETTEEHNERLVGYIRDLDLEQMSAV